IQFAILGVRLLAIFFFITAFFATLASFRGAFFALGAHSLFFHFFDLSIERVLLFRGEDGTNLGHVFARLGHAFTKSLHLLGSCFCFFFILGFAGSFEILLERLHFLAVF